MHNEHFYFKIRLLHFANIAVLLLKFKCKYVTMWKVSISTLLYCNCSFSKRCKYFFSPQLLKAIILNLWILRRAHVKSNVWLETSVERKSNSVKERPPLECSLLQTLICSAVLMNMHRPADNKYFCFNQVLQLVLSLLFLSLPLPLSFYQAGENQGVGGQSRPRSLGHPLQRRPGEPATGHEWRGEAEVLHGAQDAEVN